MAVPEANQGVMDEHSAVDKSASFVRCLFRALAACGAIFPHPVRLGIHERTDRLAETVPVSIRHLRVVVRSRLKDRQYPRPLTFLGITRSANCLHLEQGVGVEKLNGGVRRKQLYVGEER